MERKIKIRATDGFELASTCYEPAATSRGWVVISGAMGVRQQFYGSFARYLVELGISALTWDYRGIASSRPAPGAIRLHDWADKDMEGVLQWALEQGAPVACIGHSLGGQLLGFPASAPRVSAAVGVAAQSGDWRHWPFPRDVGMLLLSTVVLPGISQLAGRIPKGLMGEEIPKGPVQDWARWIRSRGYLLSEGPANAELFARMRCPMTGISIDDDGYAPRNSVDALYQIFRNASVERAHWVPKELGLRKIGHFGPFRPEFRQSLWPLLAKPVEAALG
jgi:predicted alpha/beta hydrolase